MGRIDKVAFVLAVSVLGTAPMASAQSQALSTGKSVRLFIPGEPAPMEGILFSVTPSVWTLSTPDGELRRFASRDVASAEVWATRRNTLRGALIGGGLGLAAGMLMTVGVKSVCLEASDVCHALEDKFYSETWARYYTPVLAVGVGALIGTLVKTGRWVPGLEPEVSKGGSAIALSWRLPVAF